MTPRLARRMHRDLVERITAAEGDPDEAFCSECATPLDTLQWGGLCPDCFDKGED